MSFMFTTINTTKMKVIKSVLTHQNPISKINCNILFSEKIQCERRENNRYEDEINDLLLRKTPAATHTKFSFSSHPLIRSLASIGIFNLMLSSARWWW